jgi:predicted lactoylglutathione lyase
MTKEIWINLPVKDVEKSKTFFSALGFTIHPGHGDKNSACILMGEKNIAVMLFEENMFKGFTQHPLTDTKQNSEVLISFDAESMEEVDDLAAKAEQSGGTLFGKPESIQGWMYGCGFCDPDGHRWNVLYMDKSKMPSNFN